MGGFWVETGRSIEGRNLDGRVVFDPENFSSLIFVTEQLELFRTYKSLFRTIRNWFRNTPNSKFSWIGSQQRPTNC
jgi:hypothetical protein